MKPLDTRELLNYLGLGLGLLSLALQLTQGTGKTEVSQSQRDQALMDLASQGIRSARGTNICISWDCKGSSQDQPIQEPTVPVYYRAEPNTQYINQEGQPIPTFVAADGNTYLAVTK